MSNEKLLETIGQVKEEFIEEAATKGLLDSGKSEKTVKKVSHITKLYPYLKWGALAACLCILIGFGMKMNLFSANKDAAYDAAVNNSTAESVKTETGSPYYGLTNKTEADDAEYFISDNSSVNEENISVDSASSAEHIPEDIGFPDWGLTLSVKNVTSTGLTLLVTQSGGEPTGTLQTGDPYRLICLMDGTWKTVEELPLPEGVDGRAWNSIAYLLPKGETREFDVNWEWIFGELPSGTYRLIKEFMDFRKTADYDTFEYWVEFEIQ